jgi:exosortase
MSTVDATKADAPALAAGQPWITPETWVRIALIGSAFVFLFWDIIHRLVRFAWEDGNWSHAFIVPLISVYFIYQQRERLMNMKAATSWFGLLMLIAGIVFYILGIYPVRNDMVKGYSMIMALGGLVLFMTGWRMASVLWFPVAYLVFAVKVSDAIWGAVAFKLQWIAAQVSTVALNVLGVLIGLEADVTGNHITLIHHGKTIEPALTVAEACSGLRSLMMFIALGVAVAYLAKRPWWARLIMVGSTVPVAILANVARVTALGLIYPYNRELTQGDAHLMLGLVLLVTVALVMFLLIGWILDKLVVEPDEQPEAPSEGTQA